MNIFHVFEQGDTVLIGNFMLLLLLSVLSWYIIGLKLYEMIQRKRAIRMWYKTPQEISSADLGLLLEQKTQLRMMLQKISTEHHRETAMLYFGHCLDKMRYNQEKGLTFLATIGSLSPFIGLFGTVWGIYNTLHTISTLESASLNVVSAPMGEALIATALGLFVAIPAVVAYNHFGKMIRHIQQEYRHIAEKMMLDILVK